MKCLHCRQAIFEWARRCDHCGAPVSQATLFSVQQRNMSPTDLDVSLVLMHGRYCDCFEGERPSPLTETTFHAELQDTESAGWKQILELVEIAAADSREEFAPFREMTLEAQSQVITLPATIGKLKLVRRLLLYGSFLVRIPPEIGDMDNLVEFIPYRSMRLHWFPYEITRCAKLDESTVSTRALYGNHKFRPPFPQLEAPSSSIVGFDLRNLPAESYGHPVITSCSVCRAPIAEAGLRQVWISLNVGTDVLPLLVNACSEDCISRLPSTPSGYVRGPHTGGTSVTQPTPPQ